MAQAPTHIINQVQAPPVNEQEEFQDLAYQMYCLEVNALGCSTRYAAAVHGPWNDEDELCWYHSTFGHKSTKCKSDEVACKWTSKYAHKASNGGKKGNGKGRGANRGRGGRH